MANGIEEIRYQVGEAWKGEYNDSTPYSVAAVVQDPTGLSVYRSLKNGNTGHPLTDTNWWFCIIDMSSIKAAGDNVDALNTQVAEAEARRVTAEGNRVTAESGRVTAESGRVTAEDERVASENTRKTAENARATAEQARESSEAGRVSAESGRVSAEQSRVLAENLRDSAESGRATAETNRASAEAERHTQYTADHTTAVSDHTTAAADHTTAVSDHTQATEDHSASVAATAGASNVDAELEGLTITITDREGNSHSVNIGFDIAGTYASVSAMNADAANVQEGAFVMIATSDPTSTENARLYVRNSTAPTSSEPFTFLSDLDQAASSAWADWMENYKPTIIADHERAETDHTTASADHSTAVSDHTAAAADHTQASTDHSTATSDHTTASSDHTQAESDHTTAVADHTQAESDHTRAETDHNTIESRFVKNETDIANLEENKANKDGYYSQMTVGSAENLVGQTVDSEAYLIRPTGGAENEVANGVAYVESMEGNSCVWNQMAQRITAGWTTSYCSLSDNKAVFTIHQSDSIFLHYYRQTQSFNIIAGHKYYIAADLKFNFVGSPVRIGIAAGGESTGRISSGSIDSDGHTRSVVTATNTITGNLGSTLSLNYDSTRPSAGTTVEVSNVKFIDLTLLGIANLTEVSKVEEWLAQHVGIKPYYAYNAGTILSAQTLGIKTYGQNLLNPETRQAKLIPYTWVEDGVTYSNQYTVKNIPSDATAEYTPDNTGVTESVTITDNTFDISSYGSGVLTLTAATANTYVCMKWNTEKDNDVVPYEDHTYDFDVRNVYGKVNGAGEYVQCFSDGMKGVGSVCDTLTASEAVVRRLKIDLSKLEWQTRYTGSINKTLSANIDKTYLVGDIIAGGIDYIGTVVGVISLSGPDNKSIGVYEYRSNDTTIYLVIPISSSPTGIIEVAVRDTITYTDLIYRDNGIDRPLADVLMNVTVNNWSMEEQLVTPYEDGNPTSIPATIKTQYGMDAVEAIDTLQKTCYFADDVKDNLQALLTCINTNCSEILGGTFSIGDPEEDSKVFTFTFTANTEPEP